MAIDITMPRLSDTMEEGTLIKWLVKVGDKVESGDVLADVETDKATMELQSYDDGVVARLAVAEGDTLPVGALIAVLAGEGESAEQVAGGSANAAGAEQQAPAGGSAGEVATEAPPQADEMVGQPVIQATAAPPTVSDAVEDKIKVSPVARRIAQEHGIPLSSIAGTGPDGRIIKRDVLAVVESGVTPGGGAKPQAAAAAGKIESKTVAVNNMRRTIARRLVESKTSIPHFTVTVSVDMDRLIDLRTSVNEALDREGIKLSVNDYVVRACALALADHPAVNASWAGDTIEQHGTINIGVAVALPAEKGGGLVVPTIRDVLSKDLRQISAQTRALAAKARDQGLTLEEMSDGTFTISNLGMLGVQHFEAIINPPQAAILAVGAAEEKPLVRGGQIVIGREMTCTLSCDHRVIDGAMAARFLQTLKHVLEHPAVMLI